MGWLKFLRYTASLYWKLKQRPDLDDEAGMLDWFRTLFTLGAAVVPFTTNVLDDKVVSFFNAVLDNEEVWPKFYDAFTEFIREAARWEDQDEGCSDE